MNKATSSVSERLADRVVAGAYDDIDPDALRYGKTLILDILGNAIAGASLDLSIDLVETARSWGRGDVPVWADGSKLSAPDAVLVNSHRAHCLEFDPFHEAAVVHPVTVVLPAALAAVTRLQREGRRISGKDLL